MRKFFLILLISGLLIGGFVFGQIKRDIMKEMPQPRLISPAEDIEDIMEEMPQPQFIFPAEGSKLKRTIKIEIKIEGANSVEFYLRKPESLQEIYLGMAISPERNLFVFNWDTTKTPNSGYYLFPKITNQYGQYFGLGINILVNNEIPRNLTRETQISQQIQQTEQLSRQQTQKTRTAIQSISQESQNLTEQGMKFLKEEEKAEVEEKLTKSIQEIKGDLEKFSEILKEAVKTPKQKEEAERVKKEIIEKTLTPIDIIGGKVENKIQVLEIKGKIEQEIKSQLEKLEEGTKRLEREKMEILKEILKDSDEDGLPDQEEIRLGTNPFNPDTDGDGFLDGIEYKIGYNPLKPGPADKIIYQDPRKVEPREVEIYKTERVSMVTLPTGQLGIKFEGKGRPNSFVTLYIFSSPFLVLTTRTDGNGYWEYILDKPLGEGEHEVYVTVTNNRGEITSRSDVFRFIKTPVAVAAVQPPGEKVISPTEALQRIFAILIFILIILAIGISLILIGILTKREKKTEV